MKKVATIFLCLLAVALTQCDSGRTQSTTVSNGNTTVEVTETKTTYTLNASFSRDKASQFYQYINNTVSPEAQFDFEDGDLETGASLDDGTNFRIKSHRGELQLIFDKSINNQASYQRMKKIYEGLKGIVS
ncbi:hypothetical protein WBG78_28570 [Chryseolinea sp. T2]|uniref:hypothetical protein n=1 Tax=Chryseolinea sp. T2 TaxID=3129255 RepID=UPI003076CF9D